MPTKIYEQSWLLTVGPELSLALLWGILCLYKAPFGWPFLLVFSCQYVVYPQITNLLEVGMHYLLIYFLEAALNFLSQ